MTSPFKKFFFGSLRRQLITGVATVHAVMMSLFIWDLVEKQHDMLLQQQTQLATSLTESVATSSAAWLATRDIVGMQEIIDAQRRYPELIYAMVLDKQGKVMAHTDTARRGQFVKDLPRLDQLRILSRDEKLVDIIGPVYIDLKHIGWVRVGIGQMTTQSELGNITRIGLLYALAAIIIGGIAAAYMGSRLTRRLHAIQTVVDAVEAGNPLPRVHTDGTDEAAQLGRQFNSMLDTLAAREQEIHASHDALRENEIRFRTLVENIPGIAYRCANDKNWSVEFISEEVLGITGYPASDFLSHERSYASLIHPDDVQRVADTVDASIQAHTSYVIEYRIECADGSRRWVFEKGQAIYNTEGTVSHLDGVIIDITELKLAGEALLQSEQAWKSAMDRLSDVVYLLDRDRHLVRANAAFFNMTGGNPEKLIGRHIVGIIHPQGETQACPVCRAQEELRDARIIMEADHPDNPTGKPIEIEVRVLHQANHDVTGMLVSVHDLTHDRQQQAQLAESERHFRSIIEASPVPMALNDAAANITYLNPAFIHRFGYTLADIPTLNEWWPRAYPDPAYRQHIRDEWIKRLERSQHTHTAFEPMEATIRTQAGHSCTVLASAAPLGQDVAGTHVAILYDITDRKQIENTLRASEQRFHAIADYTVDWENWVSPDGKLLWTNSSVERLTGYTPAECMSMSNFPLPLIAEEDREGVRQSFGSALHNTRGHHEFRLRRKDGSQLWVAVSWQPIYDADGRSLGHRSSIHDISALKQAEDKVRQINAELEQRIRDRTADLLAATASLAQFKTTLDQTLDCVFMFDPETLRFMYVNRGARQQVGYSEAELLQMTPMDIKPEYDETRFRREIMQHLQGKPGQPCRFETLHRHKDGHDIPIDVSVQLVKHGDGSSRCIAIVRDITERRKTEELVHKRSLDLEAANRELEAFAYSVSHDLRAPLRAIDGFSRILVEDYADKLDSSGQGYLNRVRNAVQRMGFLIDDLLELSRVGRYELHPTRLDLSHLAREVMDQLQNQDAGRDVDIRIAPHLRGTGDEMLVRLVLQNLLGNAWKFTRHARPAVIEFGAQKENGQSVYFVRDNGAGFDMQFADKLFGAFQRLHKADEFAGTGVGLATVQRIIHRHGGRVWAEAEPGKGACFYFTLPQPYQGNNP